MWFTIAHQITPIPNTYCLLDGTTQRAKPNLMDVLSTMSAMDVADDDAQL
jgi:hypothetical protein